MVTLKKGTFLLVRDERYISRDVLELLEVLRDFSLDEELKKVSDTEDADTEQEREDLKSLYDLLLSQGIIKIHTFLDLNYSGYVKTIQVDPDSF